MTYPRNLIHRLCRSGGSKEDKEDEQEGVYSEAVAHGPIGPPVRYEKIQGRALPADSID